MVTKAELWLTSSQLLTLLITISTAAATNQKSITIWSLPYSLVFNSSLQMLFLPCSYYSHIAIQLHEILNVILYK